MKRYYQHRCHRRHRSHKTLAKCVWPKAVWIKGAGPYAVVASCRALTVTLHDSPERAVAAKAEIDSAGCCSRCIGAHEVIELAVLLAHEIGPPTAPIRSPSQQVKKRAATATRPQPRKPARRDRQRSANTFKQVVVKRK